MNYNSEIERLQNEVKALNEEIDLIYQGIRWHCGKDDVDRVNQYVLNVQAGRDCEDNG